MSESDVHATAEELKGVKRTAEVPFSIPPIPAFSHPRYHSGCRSIVALVKAHSLTEGSYSVVESVHVPFLCSFYYTFMPGCIR